MVDTDTIPSGTITTFAGDVTDADIEAWLLKQGWLPCDGRSILKTENANLFFAIETNYGGGGPSFNVPDLRGRFARGINGARTPAADPDSDTRTAAEPGGNAGDLVGSSQAPATGPAVTAFVTDTVPDHTHLVDHVPVDNNGYALAGSHYALWNDGSVETTFDGAHSHTVSGGDAETRPININLNYIIRT